jgi:hypothetical protein
MTVKELIEQLRRMPPSAEVTVQTEDQWTDAQQVVWDGQKAVIWDGDHLYPVELADDPARIVPGAEITSDPPCEADYALVRRKTVLGREFGVIEEVWDA